MPKIITGNFPTKWRALTAALLIATASLVASEFLISKPAFAQNSPAAATPSAVERETSASLEASRAKGRMTRRKLEKQEFLKQHSDASGVPRPDLWRKGVEQQKQMKVAPYLGAKPNGPSAAPKTSNSN